MLVFNKEVTLADKLREYDKESLKFFASEIGFTKLSKLKKEDLVQKVNSYLLDPEVMFCRGATLTQKEIMLLEQGNNGSVSFDEEDFDSICILDEMDFIIVSDGKYIVPCDVVKVWKEIKNDKFKAYHKKASWVWKCLDWAEEMYAVTPMEIFLQVVNSKKGMRLTEEEIVEIFHHFPNDRCWTVLIQDLFVSSFYADDIQRLEHLRFMQADKEYYIPLPEEIDEFYDTGALLSYKEYQDMLSFLVKEVGLDRIEARYILLALWDQLSADEDMHDTMQWFWNQFELENDNQIEKMIILYNALSNSTRMLYNRGHKPCEIFAMQNFGSGNMPIITAGSTKAAAMLRQSAPQLQEMGFGVDLEANTSRIPIVQFPNGLNGKSVVSERKIYPNDPCPCGSGKKYKKCCGRS